MTESTTASKVALEDFLTSVGTAVQQIAGSDQRGFFRPGKITLGIILDPSTGGPPIRAANEIGGSWDLQQMVSTAGAMHGALVERITAFSRLTDSEKVAEAARAAEELRANGLLTSSDGEQLAAVLGALSNINTQVTDAINKIAQVDSTKMSLLGTLIINIARDSVNRAAAESRAAGRLHLGNPVAHADVMGALVGAGVGFAVSGGQIGGAIAGGLIGGTAASIAVAV